MRFLWAGAPDPSHEWTHLDSWSTRKKTPWGRRDSGLSSTWTRQPSLGDSPRSTYSDRPVERKDQISEFPIAQSTLEQR